MKLTIVNVSGAERLAGVLTPDANVAAVTALHEEGVVILRGGFDRHAIDALYSEFSTRYGGLDLAGMEARAQQPPPNAIQKVGDGRFEIALRMSGVFGKPALFANGIVMHFLARLLGGDLMRLGSMTAVASFPGAAMQHIHRDHPQLFHEFANIGPNLPLFAVNVSVPLIDIDETTGPTGIWPGSHRWTTNTPPREGMVSIPFQRGDCILMDYRTLHTGLPNGSSTVRPILYLVYTREWFFDDNNHRHRIPLDMPLADIEALPENLKLLMMRAYQQALRGKQLGSGQLGGLPASV
jgi:hypothetical protein